MFLIYLFHISKQDLNVFFRRQQNEDTSGSVVPVQTTSPVKRRRDWRRQRAGPVPRAADDGSGNRCRRRKAVLLRPRTGRSRWQRPR